MSLWNGFLLSKPRAVLAGWLVILSLLLTPPAAAEEAPAKGFKPEGYPDLIPPECEPVGDSYFADAVFIGDSIMVGIESASVFPEADYVCRVGMSIDGTLHRNQDLRGVNHKVRAVDVAASYQPKKIYVLLGVNTLDAYPAERALKDYGLFLDELLPLVPDCIVYLLSVPPMSKRGFEKNGTTNPARYQEFERMLRQLAQDRNLYYIDLYHLLADEAGIMKDEYAAGDYHLQKAAFALLRDYLMTHAIPWGMES